MQRYSPRSPKFRLHLLNMTRASLICSKSALPVEFPAQLDRHNHVADDYLAAIIEARDRVPTHLDE